MSEPPVRKADLATLREAREQVIARLSDAFAKDAIGVEDFEGRLTLVHRADSVSEVERVVSDLVLASSPMTLATVSALPAVSAAAPAAVTAVLGGVQRGGPWMLPRRLAAVAVFGGIVLDLREAILLPGVTEIHVMAVMGGVQMIVPPSLSVEVSGTAILGGFAHLDRMAARLDPERPLLRVVGRAILGGVAVETRLPGESERQAHRRRHPERPAFGRVE
jgi:cell wall-active antibiotic response 4TMS protein YvqF/uncharacterized protein DUF1707